MKFFKSLPKAKLQQLVLAIIGTLIGIGAVGNFFVASELSKMSEQRARIEKLTTDVKQAETQVMAEAANEGLREQMKAFVDDQQKRMVLGDPFSWVVREINLLGEKHGMADVGLNPQGKVAGGANNHFDLYVTQVAFKGSFDDIGSFVTDLENQFPLSQIRSISIGAGGGGDPSRSCQATLELALAVRPADTIKHPEKKTEPAKGAKKTETKKT